MSTMQKLVDRAEADADFRGRLKANAASAAKELGIKIPLGTTIEVHENGGDDMHLVVNDESTALMPEAVKILKRAGTDAAFKARLIKDPCAAVKEFGIELPDSLKLYVHENDTSRQHLILTVAATEDAELSDAELDHVAGGGMSWPPWRRKPAPAPAHAGPCPAPVLRPGQLPPGFGGG